MDERDVTTLVDAALAALPTDLVERIRSGLVPPYAVIRPWNYGGAAEYVCWTVFEHPLSDTGIAYCDGGFNLTHGAPWGLVGLRPDRGPMHMGDDSAWFPTLDRAFLESWAGA